MGAKRAEEQKSRGAGSRSVEEAEEQKTCGAEEQGGIGVDEHKR
jgi:hypothetical protein